MVRKLIKYDFRSFFRLLFPVQLILIGIALTNRLVQLFETSDSFVYSATFVSSLVIYIISIFVLLVMTLVISIVRFYQGMYSNEGYLSHTLPVTPTQHLFAKLLISMLFYLGAYCAIFLSFIVITFGDVNIEIFKAAGYLMKDFFTNLGFEGAMYVLEFLLVLLLSHVGSLLLIFFCISVGQLVSRKRILLAFGVYFGLYVIKQIISTVFIVAVSLNPSWFESFVLWVNHHPGTALHLILCGVIVFELIASAVYFLVSKLIMTKKLNLT